MNKEFYSTIEAARILKVSRITIFNRIKNGRIKAVKVGRNYMISHSSVLEALGKQIGNTKKVEIEQAIDKALKEYKETFRLLGKE